MTLYLITQTKGFYVCEYFTCQKSFLNCWLAMSAFTQNMNIALRNSDPFNFFASRSVFPSVHTANKSISQSRRSLSCNSINNGWISITAQQNIMRFFSSLWKAAVCLCRRALERSSLAAGSRKLCCGELSLKTLSQIHVVANVNNFDPKYSHFVSFICYVVWECLKNVKMETSSQTFLPSHAGWTIIVSWLESHDVECWIMSPTNKSHVVPSAQASIFTESNNFDFLKWLFYEYLIFLIILFWYFWLKSFPQHRLRCSTG